MLPGHDFRVRGIVPHGRGGRAYVPIKTIQELTGAENKASMFYVKLDNPDNADLASEEIKKIPGMENYNVMPMQQWLSLMSADNVPGLSIFIKVVIGISMIIGFIVIFQSMYTSVMERTREIGILKSWGVQKLHCAADPAGKRTSWHCRSCGGNRDQRSRPCRIGAPVPYSQRASTYIALGDLCDSNRRRRSDAGRGLSGVQSRAERSHRRVGV